MKYKNKLMITGILFTIIISITVFAPIFLAHYLELENWAIILIIVSIYIVGLGLSWLTIIRVNYIEGDKEDDEE